jgi:uncharacterized protein
MRKLIFLFLLFPSLTFAQNFTEKEVTFWNKDKKFHLSGTLASPIGIKKFPVVVMITGSGQTDRDESLFGIKIFKTISDHLASNGIGVLRYDDRGGFKSEGPKTTFSTQTELAGDAEAAVDFLKKEFKFKKVGILGHSEGGGLAPMVQSKNVKFIISLAGPAVKGGDLLIKQNEVILKKLGMEASKVDDYIAYYFTDLVGLASQNLDSASFSKATSTLIDTYNSKVKDIPVALAMSTQKTGIPAIEKQINGIWFRSFLSTDYMPYWKNLKIPALALYGDKDVQVDASINVKALEEINKTNIQIKTLTSHNHLFQIAKTGNADEYEKLKTSVSSECLEAISTFIKGLEK